jgi:hypothetical protein
MSAPGQIHGNFIPGDNMVIFGRTPRGIALRCDKLAKMGKRMDMLITAGDKAGLIEHAAMEHEGARRIAMRILAISEGL